MHTYTLTHFPTGHQSVLQVWPWGADLADMFGHMTRTSRQRAAYVLRVWHRTAQASTAYQLRCERD